MSLGAFSEVEMKASLLKAILTASIVFFPRPSAAVPFRAADRLNPASISGAPKYLEALKDIYREVKELGAYPGDDFISREFFLGPADDDTYKNEHIAVLIQNLDGREKMKIQVTEMEIVSDKPRVQKAGATRVIVCSIVGDVLTVERSEFSVDKLAGLAPEILRAVQAKKKLLKLETIDFAFLNRTTRSYA